MIKSKSCILYNLKVNWPYFEELLIMTTLENSISLKTNDGIIRIVESF
jgi:hypothetical protein